jgi:hypothetical protein
MESRESREQGTGEREKEAVEQPSAIESNRTTEQTRPEEQPIQII